MSLFVVKEPTHSSVRFIIVGPMVMLLPSNINHTMKINEEFSLFNAVHLVKCPDSTHCLVYILNHSPIGAIVITIIFNLIPAHKK